MKYTYMVFSVCVWISAECCHLMHSPSMTNPPTNNSRHTHCCSSTCSSASSGVLLSFIHILWVSWVAKQILRVYELINRQ
ncbi:hypothetical protein F4782DRAFT_486498 [Xylaria castorea]|nr:hypothetical protein F4782DRAFT_486498 [Xylaria castorea]